MGIFRKLYMRDKMRMMQLFDDYDDNSIAEIKNQNVFTLQLYFQQFVHDKQVYCFCSNISTFCHQALQSLTQRSGVFLNWSEKKQTLAS